MLCYMSTKLPSANHFNFTELTPHVGYGSAPHVGWQSASSLPLVILVGVTGVGKSTTLDALRAQQLPFTLLPDRRELTDRLIIAYLQREDGIVPHPVHDRMERFQLTRRYREKFPGGMSHALSQLLVRTGNRNAQDATQIDNANDPARENVVMHAADEQWWLFDGLRGVNEVKAASMLLPYARFIVLDAPDAIRVQRLVGRGDAFDHVTLQQFDAPISLDEQTFATIGVPEGDELFSREERRWLLSLCVPPIGQGQVPVDDMRSRVKIVAEERRNYDPTAASDFLRNNVAERTLLIDTTKVNAKQAARNIIQWLTQAAAVQQL